MLGAGMWRIPVGAALLMAGAAGCGSAGHGGQPTSPPATASGAAASGTPAASTAPASTPAPAAPVTMSPAGAAAGHGSPQGVVNAFFTDIVAGQNAAACGYVEPSQQAACLTDFNQIDAQGGLPTGHITAGPAVILGQQAIVGATGKFCVAGQCETSTNPQGGLPGGSLTFQQAYSKAASGTSSSVAAAACVEIGGKWYAIIQP
jgi:hypothetical protein